jgi:hypothetical protein
MIETNLFLPEIQLSMDALPSKGLSYPPGTTISYCPYTFGEIKKISGSKVGTELAFKMVLEGLKVKGMTPEELTLSDFLYIGLLRKISTIGEMKFRVQYYCEGCSQAIVMNTSTKDIDFDDLMMPRLPIVAKLKKSEMKFMPLTLGGFFGLLKLSKERDTVTTLASTCTSHEFKDAYKLIYEADREDGRTLTQVDKLLYHGIKPIKNKCINKIDGDKMCGRITPVETDGRESLILPFRIAGEPVNSAITFGVPGND